jgi:hypothetical protein
MTTREEQWFTGRIGGVLDGAKLMRKGHREGDQSAARGGYPGMTRLQGLLGLVTRQFAIQGGEVDA